MDKKLKRVFVIVGSVAIKLDTYKTSRLTKSFNEFDNLEDAKKECISRIDANIKSLESQKDFILKATIEDLENQI